MRRTVPALIAMLIIPVTTMGCAGREDTMPRCESSTRLALVAQSVPSASYVPCIAELPTGWAFESAEMNDSGSTITLRSDRTHQPIVVHFRSSCEIGDATPIAPSHDSMRTYQRVESIDPRYAGAFIDLFPGGCIEALYDFERGPHIALITDLQRAVDISSRRQLRQDLERDLGIQLDP